MFCSKIKKKWFAVKKRYVDSVTIFIGLLCVNLSPAGVFSLNKKQDNCMMNKELRNLLMRSVLSLLLINCLQNHAQRDTI